MVAQEAQAEEHRLGGSFEIGALGNEGRRASFIRSTNVKAVEPLHEGGQGGLVA